MNRAEIRWFVPAILTVAVWSSTFISTKVLLSAFTPIEILVYRFALAYVLMFAAYPRVHRPESIRSEMVVALLGITGGSAYFLAENYALSYSLASNVSLIVSTAPILTAILAQAFLGERVTGRDVAGSVIAFAGVALVILNGHFVLRLNPLGDFLALVSSLAWAGYSILIRKEGSGRSTLYLTRKVFFYTLLTVIPATLVSPVRFDLSPLLDWKLAANLLFLTVFASCGAYVVWNKVIWKIGPTRANNLIYFIPLLTMAESTVLLREPLTAFSLAGAALIFAGVYISSRKSPDGNEPTAAA